MEVWNRFDKYIVWDEICVLTAVNFGALMLQALLEHWPETNYTVPVEETGDQETSGGANCRTNSPAGKHVDLFCQWIDIEWERIMKELTANQFATVCVHV